MPNWYPQDKKELDNLLEKFLSQGEGNKKFSNSKEVERQMLNINSSKRGGGQFKKEWEGLENFPQKEIHGLIVPHAGYEFSGAVAGKAFALLKNSKIKKVIVFGPSHYIPLRGIETKNLSQEHSINNQIPFLEKLGFKEIKKIMVGELTNEEAKTLAEKFSKEKDTIFIFSTDLSHFLSYDQAKIKDKNTINSIENLELNKINENNACGIYPLLILIQLCKIKNWKPKLVEYKNSGDITGDKRSVVGYTSMIF